MSNADEETIRAAFEKWWPSVGQTIGEVAAGEAFKAFANLIPGGLPAAAALLRGDAVIVPKEPTAKQTDAMANQVIGVDAEYRAAIAATPYRDKP